MAFSGLSQKMKERSMEKKIRKLEEQQQCEYNKIKKPTNVLFNLILTILSLLSIIPFIFVIIIFLTDEEALAMTDTVSYRRSGVCTHTSILSMLVKTF